jgi:hypothetical protein
MKVNNDDSGYINVVGDWIFYINYIDDINEELCRIRIDGTGRETF